LKLISFLFLLLQLISAKLGSYWAMRFWLATRRFPEPAREQRWAKSAEFSTMSHRYGPIALYQWQPDFLKDDCSTMPLVLLIHGWNGRGLQLAAMVKPLLQQGFHVVSFDAPGHGRSPGHDSNLLRIADVVHKIAETVGPIDTIIGHSFGAMVMARVANDGLNIRKAVAISAPVDADYLINMFCSMLKINGKTKHLLLQRIKHRFSENIFSRISTKENLSQITIPGLIIHDTDDHDIPITHAHQLNKVWQNSSLFITTKLGHQRILRNNKVVDRIVEFVVDK